MKLRKLFFRLAWISSRLVPLIIALTTVSAAMADVTIRWTPNSPPPEGYRVFARRSDQLYDYSRPDWEGRGTTCTIENIEDQTDYFFVVQAYDGLSVGEYSSETQYIPDDYTNQKPEMDIASTPEEEDVYADRHHMSEEIAINDNDGVVAIPATDDASFGEAPLPPDPLFPESYARVESNPLLYVDDYLDTDGDDHAATQWQLFDTRSGACLLDLITDRRLTQMKVPIDLLMDNTVTYHWRVRFFDNRGRVSDWSETTYFTTRAANDRFGDG